MAIVKDNKIDRKKIIFELQKREWEKTISFDEAYKRGKSFISNLWK